MEVKARLGDEVKKGQLLLKVQSNDVSGAYQNYLKAANDELLARLNLSAANSIRQGRGRQERPGTSGRYGKERQADLDAATAQLKILGVNKDHPSGIVDISAPISGVITEQQITNAAGVQGLWLAESFHHLRSFLRLDRLRRL